jgi:hypothetical protein
MAISHYLLPILIQIIIIHNILIVTKAASQDELTYSEQAFDLTAIKLPPQYIGHDPSLLLGPLVDLLKSRQKGEFETTKEFHSRIHRQPPVPILGSLTTEDIFAFSSKVSSETTYDADHQTLDVTISNIVSSSTDNAYLLSKVTSTKKEYEGINLFGVRANIREIKSEWFYIEFNNHKDLKFKFDNRTDIKKLYYTHRIKNINASSAQDIKQNMRVLLICKIIKPFITLTQYKKDATINDPIKLDKDNLHIHTEALELWFYNSSSGEIYGKIRRTSQTPSNKGTSRSRGPK